MDKDKKPTLHEIWGDCEYYYPWDPKEMSEISRLHAIVFRVGASLALALVGAVVFAVFW